MAKKEAAKEGSQFAGDIYHGKRHTISLSIHSGDASDSEWHDLDIRSDVDGSKEALFDYLRRSFGEDVEIEDIGNNTFRVSDPLFPNGDCVRDYKLS